MKNISILKKATPVAMLAIVAATSVSAQPFIDGFRDASYGTTPATTQRASVIDVILRGPVNAAAQFNNSNTGGVVAYLGGNFDSDPRTVTTGLEFEASLAELGWSGGSVRVCIFINGQQHDFISNQISGGLPTATDQNVGEPRGKSFQTTPDFDGEQFLTVSPVVASGAADAIDGVKGASYPVNPLGAATGWTQQNPTRFGNNTQTNRDLSGGSEIDAVWGYIDQNGTPGNTADDKVRILVTGNLQTNNNKFEIFFDVAPGGQNTLLGAENPDVDFQGLRRMGTKTGSEVPALPGPNGVGLTFDTTFGADYWMGYVNAVNSGVPQHFLNSAVLATAGGGAGAFIGGGNKDDGMGGPNVITGNGARGVGVISAFINNSNNLGISSPNGGAGNDPPPVAPLPAAITTGMEFEIGLDQIGYDNSGSVRIGGFISGGSTDFLSNQVIGGLPAGSNSLGSPAGTKDFSVIAGNQFVTLSGIPASPASLGINVDGTRDAAYGTALWVNSNATTFGDNTISAVGDGDGSEFDALYAVVSTKNGRRTLHIFIAGNLSDYNRLWVLLDAKAGGQNILRNDNAFIDDAANGTVGALNNAAGMKFDAAFSPDFLLSYHAGANEALATTHFLDGAELLTDGGGANGDLGGRFGGGDQTAGAIDGSIILRSGFGDNTDDASDFITVDANGSELDNVYARLEQVDVDGIPTPMLYLHIGGNLEPNGNKLDIFFDVDPLVGQQRLIFDALPSGDPGYQGNPDIDFSALNRMGGPVLDGGDPPAPIPGQEGFQFDTAFSADYYLTINAGNFNSLGTSQAEIYMSYARLRGVLSPSDAGLGEYLGLTFSGKGGFLDGGVRGTSELARVDIDNTNVGGVDGGNSPNLPDVSPPGSVNTGIELRIPTSYLNWDGQTGNLKMVIFINGRGHDFVSNQFLQSICANDLGEPRSVNLANRAGDQYLELAYNVGTGNYTNTRSLPPDCANCPGDANGSGTINGADLSVLLAQFGTSVTPGTGADFNGDGNVNGADLSVLLSNFGGSCL